ncbi:PspC domain-containing protein [Zhihengliuella salsuginis]|uniref:Phage shock protein PspC N-terminal domain-containing protein n=1 Tax=Zhihengliuella salsuginis TaxID=578222 RepID=A0ABQ3GKY2_9MICC|nr:PspC domain-containing protein [Zhihengliuella salsuginis]GHD13458.1 hypothetical protein GCM10008096_29670 [Zhihengliuella salsuginis]
MDKFFDALRSTNFRRGPGRWVGGIAGGIAAHFGWDPILVRIGVLLSFLLPVVGIGAYVVAWLLLPWQDGSIPLEKLISGNRR